METNLAEAKIQVDRLTQSILAKAFRGGVVIKGFLYYYIALKHIRNTLRKGQC